YHKFTIGWAWAADYGTSEESREMFDALYAYSPLHNIKPGVKYPAALILTGDHDDRVVPAHSFKFAATLQKALAETEDARPALIRIDTNAGHGRGKPTSMQIDENTDIFSFILWQTQKDRCGPPTKKEVLNRRESVLNLFFLRARGPAFQKTSGIHAAPERRSPSPRIHV
ncbi:MAG: S9 family peptidase, partial [Thermoguttaceae bacterium]|nr:S9 family peptidase [Thermoguttaceae bacterium]